MMDIEKIIEEDRKKREAEYDEFMQTCHDKITSGELIYRSLALFIAKKYKLHIDEYFDVDDSVYEILNYYIENVDQDFEKWLNREDGPFIRPKKQLRKIFPEFNYIKSDNKLVETVNKVYDLSLKLSDECIYSLEFSFDFKPINAKAIKSIKDEIAFCKKYGNDYTHLLKELEEYNIPEEIINQICKEE